MAMFRDMYLLVEFDPRQYHSQLLRLGVGMVTGPDVKDVVYARDNEVEKRGPTEPSAPFSCVPSEGPYRVSLR